MSLLIQLSRPRTEMLRHVAALCVVLLTAAGLGRQPEAATTSGKVLIPETTGSLPVAEVALDQYLPAAPPQGQPFTAKFSYSADQADLADVLKAFAVSQGLSVVVSPNISGKVTGQFDNVDPKSFLQSMASTYGVTWYRENSILYFFAANEIRSQFLTLELLEPAQALSLIRELGFFDPRFPIKSLENPPMLHVTGPPRYIESVQAIAQAAERRLRQRLVRREEVRIFKLQHAFADDTQFTLRDKQQVVPGIASTLRRLMIRNQQGSRVPESVVLGNARGAGILTAPRVQRELPLSGVVAPAGVPVPGDPEIDLPLTVEPLPPPVEINMAPAEIQAQLDPTIVPSIEADPRQNAVIVRDSAERMPLYEEMIRQLDVPTQLVEIHACIVDINEEVAFEAGLRALIEFDGSDGKSGQFGINTIPSESGSGNLDSTDISGEIGNVLASGVVLSDHYRFLALVQALEDKGQARIYSRPSLVTFANLEAELRDDQTYNVRVAGERDAELFSVTAGVQLRVTPYVINNPNGPPRIQMTVHIEDGSFEDNRVDDLPLVRTSSLNTQAIVNLDQSLLVGGYLRNTDSHRVRAVPGVSRIPLVGELFKGRRHEVSNMQRMFVLTPRLITLDYSCPPEQLESTRGQVEPAPVKSTRDRKKAK